MRQLLRTVKKLGLYSGALCVLLALPQISYSDTPPTTTLSIDASATTGNNGWYTSAVPVTLTAVGNSSQVDTITHWIDDSATISGTENPALRTLVQQGSHTLKYFATDTSALQEPIRYFSYKIDLVSPGNWNAFTLTQSGNNHTFLISVNVKDKTSGLDPSTAEFQYSVDNGTTWGYYSTLTSCGSTWNNDAWKSATISPATQGVLSATINIPQTDYCNSNWAQTKYIRIRIKDMAGLMATKQYALMSPWIQTTGGDIYSRSSIDMITEPSGSSATGLVSNANDTQNNLTSSQGWKVYNYQASQQEFYNNYLNKFGGTPTALPNTFPTASGVYKTNDYALTSVPNSLSSTQNAAIIVFVQGNLFINQNIQLHPTSTLMWIVSGDIGIKDSVTRADGVYISEGEFDSSYNTNGNNQLLINGAIYSNGGITLSRSLNGNDNLTQASEKILFPPGILMNSKLTTLMKITNGITWKEYVTY